jgi:hypothetical protein
MLPRFRAYLKDAAVPPVRAQEVSFFYNSLKVVGVSALIIFSS